MGLGLEKARHYVAIREGKILKKENGHEERFDFIEGRLTGLYKVSREINGVDIEFYQLEIDDLILSLRADSGLIMGILNCLASVDGFLGNIKIKPYNKDGFNKIIIFHEGQRLNWKYQGDELPKKEGKNWGLFIGGLAQEVQGKIAPVDEPF